MISQNPCVHIVNHAFFIILWRLAHDVAPNRPTDISQLRKRAFSRSDSLVKMGARTFVVILFALFKEFFFGGVLFL